MRESSSLAKHYSKYFLSGSTLLIRRQVSSKSRFNVDFQPLRNVSSRTYSTEASKKKFFRGVMESAKKQAQDDIGKFLWKVIVYALIMIGGSYGAADYWINKIIEIRNDLIRKRNFTKEMFRTLRPDTEKLKDNYMKNEFELIKEQILKLNEIQPDFVKPDDIYYDQERGKLIVFFNFKVNNKIKRYRHYFDLASHGDMATLENAINADLAFKEFFVLLPALIVKTNYPANNLLVIEPSWNLKYFLGDPQEIPGISSICINDIWDGNEGCINVAKLKNHISQNHHVFIPGDFWKPTFKVTLPVFKSEKITNRQDIVDLISGRSWRPDGPVKLEDLVLIRIAHRDFNGQIRSGRLIVHQEVEKEVLEIFEELFEKGVKIKQAQLIDYYFHPGERYRDDIGNEIDQRSMQANNSSALFVRKKTDGNEWSQHSIGKAIDINPLQNPYVRYKDDAYTVPPLSFEPTNAQSYYTHKDVPGTEIGTIHSDDVTVQAFKKRGWKWGGFWKDKDHVRDYQHFSKLERSERISVCKRQ